MSQQTVHLAVYDTLADWEASYAIAAINHPQFQHAPGRLRVATVAERLDPVTTMGGVRIQPELDLATVDPQDSAMLILSGSELWEQGQSKAMAAAARRFLDAGAPVAAICGATFGLALEGLLDDRDHTGAAPEYLAASGYGGAERYRDERVVSDRGVITAGPTEPVPFAREILAMLDVYAPPVLDAWFGLYDTGEPRYFYELMAAVEAQGSALAQT